MIVYKTEITVKDDVTGDEVILSLTDVIKVMVDLEKNTAQLTLVDGNQISVTVYEALLFIFNNRIWRPLKA